MYHLVNMDHPYYDNPVNPEGQNGQSIQQHCEMLTVNIHSLIAEVEARNVLWDKNHLYYNDRNMRRAAWQEVYKALSPNFDQLPKLQQVLLASAIERRWRSLREGFSKKVRNELNLTRRRAPYIYHQQLNFLRKVIIPRNTGTEDEDNPESQSQRRTQLEEKLAQFLDMQSQQVRDDHQNFFDSLLPLVRKFDEQQSINFRGQVLNLIQDMRVSACTPESPVQNLSEKTSDSIMDGFPGNYQQNPAPSHSYNTSLGAEQSAYVSQGPSSTSDSGIGSPVCASSLIQSAVCAALNLHPNAEI